MNCSTSHTACHACQVLALRLCFHVGSKEAWVCPRPLHTPQPTCAPALALVLALFPLPSWSSSSVQSPACCLLFLRLLPRHVPLPPRYDSTTHSHSMPQPVSLQLELLSQSSFPCSLPMVISTLLASSALSLACWAPAPLTKLRGLGLAFSLGPAPSKPLS